MRWNWNSNATSAVEAVAAATVTAATVTAAMLPFGFMEVKRTWHPNAPGL